MNNKLAVLVLSTFLLISSNVNALNFFTTSKISQLIVHDSGDIIIQLNGNVANSENCTLSDRLVLQRSHISFKEMYAALLSSFHSQTSVSGFVNGCSNEWQSKGMPYLIRLDLSK
ncbi:hypothetical protein [Acinetobacter sp.]|uniref:hypothetical protein n=1 Tax=Acinetobacter sp. TaxID=472 RepID=UPI00281BC1BD|nr:hypothetical protein [Acinetobacter sp.]MDR0237814.1 hypothetical protein [Acinetobacter sp.]